MTLFHRTSLANAEAILRDGFKDGVGRYMTNRVLRGVWLSTELLDGNEGAYGDVLLTIRIPAKMAREYEVKEPGKGYREFLIPAAVLNGHMQGIEAATVVCGALRPFSMRAARIPPVLKAERVKKAERAKKVLE